MQISRLAPLLLVCLSACAGARDRAKPVATASPVASQTAEQPVDASPALPRDPAVRTGQLANGLTYYIRKHAKPEKRVLMWLAVDAGSVLEDDDQRGLAHFVEHMAFNGTARFEKNKIIEFFERSGMRFGADANAYTSFDETVYQLAIPTDDPKLVTTGFDVLEDWAGAVSFDPGEVDKERGVVVEEWRLGRGAYQRVLDKQMPIYLEGSKYAQRLPIGEKPILEGAPVDTLKRFYKDWYRPDLMAVIIVGDVDPAAMQKEIEARFGKLKTPEGPRPRPQIDVPLFDRTAVAVLPDPEMPNTSVSVSIKAPIAKHDTEADFRRDVIEDLFHGMLRARFDELSRKPDAPFVYAFSSTSPMGRAVDVFNLSAGAKAGQIDATLKTLLLELERVRQHGFVATELERRKIEMLRELERAVAEQDKVDARKHAFDLVRHFLLDRALPSAQLKLDLAKQLLPGVTLAEVNARAEAWTNRKDRVVIASGPARDQMPTEKGLVAVVDGVKGVAVDPYRDEASSAPLLAQEPKAGTITKTETIAELGLTVWTLSNGARVVVKPTDFKNDEVLFEAFSPGGHSLVKDPRFESARFAEDIVEASGLASHDPVTLKKMLAGKVVRLSPYVGELEEGLRGSASPRDLETMMQLVHLTFTAPRKDPDAFAAWKAGVSEWLRNVDLNPQQSFFREVEARSYQNHRRRQPPTLGSLDKTDLDQALDIYRERFADAGDFTFVFVGNVDVAQLEGLATRYLASLPTTGRKEKWKDVGARHPSGVKSFEVEKGQDPKSFVWINFHGPAKWTPENEDDLEMLSEAMRMRLREVLREDMSGVYGVFANADMDRRPKPGYDYTIGFGCAPENVESLRKAVFDIADQFRKQGIDPQYVEKVREQRKRALEVNEKENRYWARELAEHYRFGTDPRELLDREKQIERVTVENIQSAAKRYLNPKRYIVGVLKPQDTAAPANPNAPKPAGG